MMVKMMMIGDIEMGAKRDGQKGVLAQVFSQKVALCLKPSRKLFQNSLKKLVSLTVFEILAF